MVWLIFQKHTEAVRILKGDSSADEKILREKGSPLTWFSTNHHHILRIPSRTKPLPLDERLPQTRSPPTMACASPLRHPNPAASSPLLPPKPRQKGRRRCVINLRAPPDLLDPPRVDHGDPLGHRQSFPLAPGSVNSTLSSPIPLFFLDFTLKKLLIAPDVPFRCPTHPAPPHRWPRPHPRIPPRAPRYLRKFLRKLSLHPKPVTRQTRTPHLRSHRFRLPRRSSLALDSSRIRPLLSIRSPR